MDLDRRVVFFSLMNSNYSRSGVYLNFNKFREQSEFFHLSPSINVQTILKLRKSLFDLRSKNQKIVVMSPSHLLVPIIRLFTNKSITLDAGWSLTEGALARWSGIRSVPNIFKSIIIDGLAFHLASKIIVESNHQRLFLSKYFLVRKKKIFVLFTGVDETNFRDVSETPIEFLDFCSDERFPIVLFRGSYTKEAGLELLAAVSKRMETINLRFVISCRDIPKEIVFARNTVLISRKISNNEMKYLYENATVCIGQISDRPRLKNTIPHKAFEAAFFRKPYLSADASGIREFLPSNDQCFYLGEKSIVGLEKAIIEITENVTLQKNLTSSISKRYEAVATQEILSERFFTLISD
jgi:glycosyltransferase involved in cell wall biosynthesis